MDDQILYLKNKFQEIKDLGWIKSINKGNNGVGLTFESLLGISQNELEIPDYNGIEIKTKRNYSKSYITLFSCKPEGRFYHEVERIKDTYGYPHKKYPQYKVLNNSVFANIKNKIDVNYYFKLDVCRQNNRIYLEIYSRGGKLIEKEVFWDFDILKEKLYRKLKILAYVKAYSGVDKIIEQEYFKYSKLEILSLKSFEKFIDLVELGIIRINFKLNIETKAGKIGKIHDHGTSFDILEKDLPLLYNKIEVN